MNPSRESPVHFGPYRFDPHTLELSRNGQSVSIAPQPARLLALLVSHAGEMVSRERIREHVWGDQALDFEAGLHTCVRQVRRALDDDPDEPEYVETLPRRGYRFIAPVEVADRDPGIATRGSPARGAPMVSPLSVVAAIVIVGLAAMALWWYRVEPGPTTAGGDGTESAIAETDPPARLVVLPFRDLTGREELDYLGAALAEEIRSELARVGPDRLAVIASASSAAYAERAAGVGRIVDDLAVSHLLEGSVRTTSDGPVVNLRLVRAEDQTQVWAHRFVFAPGDDGDVVLDVASRVAAHLAPAVGVPLEPRREAVELAAPEARRAVLEARFLMRPGARDPEAAAERLRRALELEPDLVGARALLADALRRLGRLEEARQQASSAIAAAPDRYEAHLVLGDLELYDRVRPDSAGPHYERALELAPGVAEVQQAYAGWLLATGRPEASITPLRRAMTLDPVSPIVHGDMPWYLLYARDYDGVVETTRRALDLVPEPTWVLSAPVFAAIIQNQHEIAVEWIMRVLEATDADPSVHETVTSLAPSAGVEAWLRYQIARTEEAARGSSLELARLHALAGDEETALDLLEEASRDRGLGLAYVKIDPRLDSLRDRPRFEALLARIDQKLSS